MRIAVFSDIHANNIALKEVLNDAGQFNIDHLFILGDIIGYYYWPDDVLELLSIYSSFDFIKGNHEAMLKEVLENKIEINMIKSRFGTGIEKTIAKLTADQQDFLINLPGEKHININGCKFLLCHGSPFDMNRYVYPDSDFPLLKKCAVSGFDFVFMGHTHHPFCFHHNNITVANPGSVGQPRDIGNLASYLIVDTDNKTLVFRRIPFDINPIMKECMKNDPDKPFLREIFLRNAKFYGVS